MSTRFGVSPDTEPSTSPFVTMQSAEVVALSAGFAVFYVAVLALGLPSASNENYYVYGALLAYIAVLVGPLILFRLKLGWFHPLVMGALLAAPELLRSFPGYVWGLSRHIALPEWSPRELTELFAWSIALQALSLLCVYIGFVSWARPHRRPVEFVMGGRQTVRVTIAVFVAVLATAAFILPRGGLVSHLIDLGKGRHAALAGEFYFILPARIGLIAWMFWLASDHKNVIRNPFFWMLGAVAVITTPLLTFSRSRLVFDVAAALVLYMLRARRVFYARTFMAAVAAVYFVIAVGDLRTSTWKGKLDGGQSYSETLGATLQRGWSDTFVQRSLGSNGTLAILARVPDDHDYLYGETYLDAAALPIPRSWWPNKPGLVGGRVGRTFFHTTAGVPPGAVGESYWNFGYSGIVVIHLLFGMFLRSLADLYQRAGQAPAVAVVYSYLTIDSRPETGSIVVVLMNLGMIILVAKVFMGVKSKRARKGDTMRTAIHQPVSRSVGHL